MPSFILMHICKHVKTYLQVLTLETLQKCAYKIGTMQIIDI